MFSDLKYRLNTLTRITMIGESENVAKKAVAEASISGSFFLSRMKASRTVDGIDFKDISMLHDIRHGKLLKIVMDAYTSY